MTSISISCTFLESLNKLDKTDRKIVLQNINDFYNQKRGNGFQIHAIEREKCDKRFRSARINDNLRMILAQDSESYLLLYVDHHDDAYKWTRGKYLDTSNFGALYLQDISIIGNQKAIEQELSIDISHSTVSLLEKQGINVKDIERLGITSSHAKVLVKINNEDDYIDYISVFPEELQEALIDLETGCKGITEVYAELNDDTIAGQNDLEKALSHKDSKRRFYIIQDMKEFEHIVEEDFETWKLFLHPKQDKLVKQNYRGPVLIEGGPGTGKTVVGIHRAVYLSQNIYPLQENKRILMCTFSRKLALYIQEKVLALANQKEINNNIDVVGIDSLIYKLLSKYTTNVKQADTKPIEKLLRDVFLKLSPQESLFFYQSEYEEIVQKYHVRTIEDYLKVDRKGLGKGLNAFQRRKIWSFFEVFLKAKEDLGLVDYEDQAFEVYKLIQNGVIQPNYDSIIIDEAQDLSPIKLKVLTKLVRTKMNNIMLLSDQNQRIFRMNSWRKDVQIDVVGRTFHLDLNYRTTKQIREYADNQFIKSEILRDHIKEYKSLISGPEPEVHEFEDKKYQYNYIIKRIHQLLDQKVRPYEICIVSPNDLEKINTILEYEGLFSTILEKNIYPSKDTGIGLSTLHGIKGLEFKVVIIANYDEIPSNVDCVDDDWYAALKIKQMECLKYVAATRAKEELIVTYTE